jgi:hypothetical protein
MDSIHLMNSKQQPLSAFRDHSVSSFRQPDLACLACFLLAGASEKKRDTVELRLGVDQINALVADLPRVTLQPQPMHHVRSETTLAFLAVFKQGQC